MLGEHAFLAGLPCFVFFQPVVEEDLEEAEELGVGGLDGDDSVELEEGVKVECGGEAELRRTAARSCGTRTGVGRKEGWRAAWLYMGMSGGDGRQRRAYLERRKSRTGLDDALPQTSGPRRCKQGTSHAAAPAGNSWWARRYGVLKERDPRF